MRARLDAVRDQAKLLPSDVARLLKLNRVTVSQWFNGHAEPHPLHAKRVGDLLDVIAAAVEAGKFPVPFEITRRERAHYIEKVVAEHTNAETR
jgi:transcriptional regulator with XRE-family HTH domain